MRLYTDLLQALKGERLSSVFSRELLAERLKEYTNYFITAGWPFKQAHAELQRGVPQISETILCGPQRQKTEKLAWVTKYDHRIYSQHNQRKSSYSVFKCPEWRNIPKDYSYFC